MTRIALQKKVLGSNDALADDVRSRLTARHIVAVNLMGSPGSGKTSLIETTARLLRQDIRAAALTGDQATEHDAQRIRAAGIPAIQITTEHSNQRSVSDLFSLGAWPCRRSRNHGLPLSGRESLRRGVAGATLWRGGCLGRGHPRIQERCSSRNS